MRKGIYIVWGLWLLGGIVLGILHLISWWWATSGVWFPLLVGLSAFGGLLLIADIGARLKMAAERRIPDSCANCLFGSSCDIINSLKKEGEERHLCIGEKYGHERGTLCEYYIRSKEAKIPTYNPLMGE